MQYPITEVYPRVCGGTCLASVCPRRVTGLSPRVRGNLGECELRDSWQRSIPACAGEPREGGAATTSDSVYPRVCGGTVVADPKL